MERFNLQMLKQGIEELRTEKYQEDKNGIAKALIKIIDNELKLSEDYKRQVLVYPDYQKGYSFSSNDPLSLEDSLPLYPPQFSKIKMGKDRNGSPKLEKDKST